MCRTHFTCLGTLPTGCRGPTLPPPASRSSHVNGCRHLAFHYSSARVLAERNNNVGPGCQGDGERMDGRWHQGILRESSPDLDRTPGLGQGSCHIGAAEAASLNLTPAPAFRMNRRIRPSPWFRTRTGACSLCAVSVHFLPQLSLEGI